MDLEEQPLVAKYESNVAAWDQIVKLMGRVGARVL
jgi:hypothetical protein